MKNIMGQRVLERKIMKWHLTGLLVAGLLSMVMFTGCSRGSKVISETRRSMVAAGWSDNRHLAYIVENYAQGAMTYQLWTADIAHDGTEVIRDTMLSADIGKPYAPIAYDHTMELVFLPDGSDILAFDIAQGRSKPFSMNLPIKQDIEKLYANPAGCLAFALPSQYYREYGGKGFWWLVLLDTKNGEIVYSTDDAWKGGGFFLETTEPVLNVVVIDTTGPDTLALAVDTFSRRTSPSKYTVRQITDRYRRESYSPDLTMFPELTGTGLVIRKN